jgi:hypothetical protein
MYSRRCEVAGAIAATTELGNPVTEFMQTQLHSFNEQWLATGFAAGIAVLTMLLLFGLWALLRGS